MVLPFGLTNTPYFKSLMNEVLRLVLRKYVLVFFHDPYTQPNHGRKQATVTKGVDIIATKKLNIDNKKCSFG